MQTDDQLMQEIALGKNKAFVTLFERHSGKVLGYAMRLMGGDRARAEDISQMVWMKIIKAAPAYKSTSNFSAWLLTIVRHTSFNEMRGSKRRAEEPLSKEVIEAVTVDSIEQELVKTSDTDELKKRIDGLPEMQRLVLVAFMTEGLSYDDIASQLDISVSSVKSLLFRARQNLAGGKTHE
jgi:RNA polymerase sigma-70 factor, ECF subfamily